jgi:hypothetical protein
VKYDKAIEKLVVSVDCLRDLIPASCVYGTAVKELFELKNAVSDTAFICADWGP